MKRDSRNNIKETAMSNNDKVVPATINRPKRVAKKLHVLYPTASLAECQHVTALLFGHTSWHALENSIRSGDDSAPYDGDLLDDYDRLCRKNTQVVILIKHLPYPYFNSIKVSSVLPSDSEASIGLYAADVIDEVAPTQGKVLPATIWPTIIPVITKNKFARLPEFLARWWLINVPGRMDVYHQLLSIKLDPEKRSSIRSFSHYWEILCIHNPVAIPDNLVAGVAFMLALRYSECSKFELPTYSRFRMRLSEDKKEVIEAFRKIIVDSIEYLGSYPHLYAKYKYTEDNSTKWSLIYRKAQEMLSIGFIENEIDVMSDELAWIRS